MHEYQANARGAVLSPGQSRFVRSRIHWGAHLPGDVLDGLRSLADGRVQPPPRPKLNILFDCLVTLERRVSPDGRRLEEWEPSAREELERNLAAARGIVVEMCGWE